MRRARIKAVANVPVRRKAVQDAANQPEAPVLVPDVIKDIPADDTKSVAITSPSQTEEFAPQTPLEDVTPSAADPSPVVDKQEEPPVTTELPISLGVSSSPDHTFATLKSPPYRADSFKSDAISLKSPASPSKLLQNRSRFVRPVPRLDGSGRVRRNSIQGSGASASESEDDSRRSIATVTNRIRNDSCCSVQSSKEIPTSTGITNIPEVKAVPKRRMVISESARKLAEARREFLQKHGSKTPDRNKLTMYDLIYYNPVTNPMKSPSESATVVRNESPNATNGNDVTPNLADEEDADEPTAMPVPQVKVGPDGQLVIDEQSLVIEQTGAKRSREALANSQVVIDDGGTGSGFYKRRRKAKDWPKRETLRFYKALNTIGTDFLLMQSLFPKRTRQEIKLKFKKEEKTNRQLVEKALKYHTEFDLDWLEEELAKFEEQEKLEELNEKKPKEIKEKSKNRKKCCFVNSSIKYEESDCEDMDEEDADDPEVVLTSSKNVVGADAEISVTNNNNTRVNKPTKTRAKQKRSCSIDKALDDLMQGARIFIDSDSDPEIYERRPTRSGRFPKIRKLQAPSRNKLEKAEHDEPADENTIRDEIEIKSPVDEETDKFPEESPTSDGSPNSNPAEHQERPIPDMSHVEPGSLVILSSESADEPGKTMLQVFMVSPNTDPADTNGKKNITPVNLSPELLATVTTKTLEVDPNSTNADEKPPVETS